MAIGKISGPLLKENLLRDGVDLAFETDLIYLDVNNRRVGIKTSTPSHDLTVNGTTRTTNLEVTTGAVIGNITFSGDQISSSTSTLDLQTNGNVVYQNRLLIDSLKIEGNAITNVNPADPNINITANGTGNINLNSDTLVNGNLHATGTITADGNITIGDADTDNVIFNADVASDILPDVDNLYQLGSASKRWKDVYVNTITASTVSAGSISVAGIDIALSQGNIYYVATNGNDNNSGIHQNDPLSSVGRALDLASAGDTIYIYPGVYQETLPLVVPVGVTVKGTSLRSVTIEPDSDVTVDMFLLNGETTIEDITIRGFEYDAITNTGYAFRFAPGFKVTTRSPYIRNVTVITAGSTVRLMTNPIDDPRGFLAGDAGKGVYLDGSIADPTSNEASCLFHSVTFICPGVDVLTAINGVRIEWLNCFTYFADRGLYLRSGSTGFAGAGKTRIKITSTSGTFNVGNTLTYYDTNGTTVLASGVISSIDGSFYNINGKVSGFETITDRTSKTVTVAGDAKLKTAIKKYGTSSLYLDGAGDYLAVASQPDFNFGTGDISIEAWVYPTTTGTFRTLFDFRASTGDLNGIIIGISNIDALYFYYNGAYRVVPAGSVPINTWTHVAFTKTSGSTKLWVGGVQAGITYADANNYPQRGIRIGADPNGNFAFTGYIDDVRICKGTSKYTSTFTPPLAALNGDNSTVLLLHFDGLNNSTTIIDDGVTLQDIRTSAGGTASIIDFADYSDFGAELRSIGSANVYGNYGAYGIGEGVLGYLVGQNFAYIGSGRLSDNDPIIIPNDSTNVNEVVQFDRAKIYYTSVDAQGNFKVGDFFKVDQATGEITFSGSNISITASTGIIFTDGINTTEITPTKVETGNIRISGNTIESTSLGITITAANNQINLLSDTTVENLTVSNNLTVNGNSSLGNTNSDTITVQASVASDIIPTQTSIYDLGSSTKYWRNVYLNSAQIDDINISGNVIKTTVSNSNLEFIANGSGIISVPQNDVVVNQDLIVNGLTTLENVSVNGTITVNTFNTPNEITTNAYNTDDIRISGNVITTTLSNSNLELRANGTGFINIQDNAVVDSNLTVTGNTGIQGNLTVANTITATNLVSSTLSMTGALTIDDIEINGNVIRTTASNTNLELRTNGTGTVELENFSFNNNVITSTSAQDFEIVPSGTGVVKITSNQAIQIPVGSDAQRPVLPQPGMIRFNNTINQYEGYNGTYWIQLGGVSDVDRNTYIIPESSPGANDNTIYFYTNNQLAASLNSSLFNVNKLRVDNVEIDGNVIRTTTTNTDLELKPNGTGVVVMDNFAIGNNTILNTTFGGVTEFQSTGAGYYRIGGNNAVVIPAGDNAARPLVGVVGMVRWNTAFGIMEAYDGSNWVSVAGTGAGINAAQAQDIALAIVLSLG